MRAAAAPSVSSLAERLEEMPEAEREKTVLDLVRAEVAAVLGHASDRTVRPEHAFQDLGFDSLTAVELRNRLNKVTGLRLPATLVFDHPTPALLARHVFMETAGAANRPSGFPTCLSGQGRTRIGHEVGSEWSSRPDPVKAPGSVGDCR